MTKLIERVSFVLKATAAPVASERVNMGQVVFRVLQRHETRILKKSMTVSEPASWPEVNGVSCWLEVVWGNFLMNALCHGNDRVELGWQKDGTDLLFSISDNGAGIPTEKCQEMFQPFESLHQPGPTHGLGLPIVRRLMELQGGGFGCKPRLESGSFF